MKDVYLLGHNSKSILIWDEEEQEITSLKKDGSYLEALRSLLQSPVLEDTQLKFCCSSRAIPAEILFTKLKTLDPTCAPINHPIELVDGKWELPTTGIVVLCRVSWTPTGEGSLPPMSSTFLLTYPVDNKETKAALVKQIESVKAFVNKKFSPKAVSVKYHHVVDFKLMGADLGKFYFSSVNSSGKPELDHYRLKVSNVTETSKPAEVTAVASTVTLF